MATSRKEGRMSNDECPMTKEARNPNDKGAGAIASSCASASLGLRHSTFFRHSSFVLGHCTLDVARDPQSDPAIGVALHQPKTIGRAARTRLIQPEATPNYHEAIAAKTGWNHAFFRSLWIFLGT